MGITKILWVAGVMASVITVNTLGATFDVVGGTYQFFPRALSGDKTTLVGFGLTPSGTSKLGMIWTRSGGMSYLPDAGPVQYSIPTGISSDATVIVGYNSQNDTTIPPTAWRWTAASGYQGIDLGGVGAAVGSLRVSGDGQTVVGQTQAFSVGNIFVSTGAGTVAIPVEGGGGPVISTDGSVVGGEAVNGQGYIWTSAGGLSMINGLPGAVGIVPDVILAGGSEIFGTAKHGPNAFVFSYKNGVMESVGSPSIPNGVFSGIGLAGVTADGSLMVGSLSYTNGSGSVSGHEFWVWTVAGGFETLGNYLTSEGVNVGNYTINNITGISADGTTLFGSGLVNGIQPSGWVAVVPEPSTMEIGMMGLVGLVLRRRGCEAGRRRV